MDFLQFLATSTGALPYPIYLQIALVAIFVGGLCFYLTRPCPSPHIPLITLDGEKSSSSLGWCKDGKAILDKGTGQSRGPFQINTGTGPKIVLPYRYVHEIRNNPDLNFQKAVAKDFFSNYPGFEGLTAAVKNHDFIQQVVRVKLTQSLALVTKDLVEETTDSMQLIFGDDPEYCIRRIKQDILNLVARMSSRVFLGKDLARNERWLQIAKEYTVDAFVASAELRAISPIARPFVHWFNPTCRRLRAAVRDAELLIQPEVEKRVERVRQAQEAGVKPPKVSDTIGWMHEVARGQPINYTHGQLSLSVAAIHTTSETLTQAVLDLCTYPDIVQPLRDEVIKVIGDEGWAKTSLYKLKLMDSFLKESQRVNVMLHATMNRYVERTVTLEDGTVLPKGARVIVATTGHSDPAVYRDPEKFDMRRFLDLRATPGQENNWQFVTTSPEHLMFGHGAHACPGRFFASNEIKIALCCFLLRYDLRLVDGGERPKSFESEGNVMVDPEARVLLRRRREEVDLGALVA